MDKLGKVSVWYPDMVGKPKLWLELRLDFEAKVDEGPLEWRRRETESLGNTWRRKLLKKKRNVKVRPDRPWSTGCPCCPTQGGKDQSESRRRSPSP